MPIAGRGFRLFLERATTAPARIPASDIFWPDDCSPFRRWMVSQGFRIIRLTDRTIEYGAGEGRAYAQARYRLPRWCREFHQELRRIGREEGLPEIPREACLALLDRLAPHSRTMGFGERMRHEQTLREPADDGFGPLARFE
jgi:hypothetical protein